MKIRETLERDPLTSALANNGQARLETEKGERALQELRAELETFVCDGEYGRAIEKILSSYLTQLDRPRQKAAWVSGFFGSGKSHLLKILGHLWVDTPFSDGATARSLVHHLPDEVHALLRELDTAAMRTGLDPVAVSGSMPSGTGEMVRSTVLSFILRACDLPPLYAQAQFCFWLREEGYLDAVRQAVEAEGRDWHRELNDLYVSGVIARGLLECDPNFAQDEKEARHVLRSQFPRQPSDITTAQFLEAARKALGPDGELPLTILVLDEVQQYLGDSRERVSTLTELVEAIYSQLDSRVMLVMAGQSALSGTPLLQWMQDRFEIRIQLTDADVEAVTRKVLLSKKASAVEPIQSALNQNAGEISKHLQGTKLAERPEDRKVIVEDYPLLPTRRRFWEEAFRAVDAAGTQSQLRSQLRILYDALRDVAEDEIGKVISADVLYEATTAEMINTGVLPNEIATLIAELDDGTETGRLRKHIAGLVFLISKLPREGSADVGVRATARMIADLMVDDLRADSGALRKQIEEQLEALYEEGKLMKVGEEYRLQTTEGAEWDRAFREHVATLQARDTDLEAKREQLLGAEIQQAVGEVRLSHGESKIKRTILLHVGVADPPEDTDQIVVWLRDGWSTEQKEVEAEARRRGLEDPVIHLFIPKRGAQERRQRICAAEAARRVLDLKGVPASDGGKEARKSMESRLAAIEAERDELVRELIDVARVYQGGGTEVFGDSLAQKIREAAEDSLSRLFTRFAEGDHRAWEVALKRAREGSDQPLGAVGWERPTEEHPVVQEILSLLVSPAKGTEIRKKLKAPPFGWPQDAIDAALVALHQSGTLRAELNGTAVRPRELDQNKIAATTFKLEQVRLGTRERLTIRSLYQTAGVVARRGEEEVKAGEFIAALRELAEAAGGDPPLPPKPSTKTIEELNRLSGNDQLAAFLTKQEELDACIEEWKALKERREERLPQWERLEQLLKHAEGLSVAEEVLPEVEAIRNERTLLAGTDYVLPLRKKLGEALRKAVQEAYQRCQGVFEQEMKDLEASENWKKLDEPVRDEILRANHLEEPDVPDVADEERLLASLSRRNLGGWEELAAALPTRFANARSEAARSLEPETQTVTLRSDVMSSEEEVEEWLNETKEDLLRRLEDGPIVIG